MCYEVSEEDVSNITNKFVQTVAVCCGDSINRQCPLADDQTVFNCLKNIW
jgi:hypothetical protein